MTWCSSVAALQVVEILWQGQGVLIRELHNRYAKSKVAIIWNWSNKNLSGIFFICRSVFFLGLVVF